MRLSQLRPVLRRDDRGAELIELAITLPIVLLAMAAIVDFGFLFQRYEVVTNAAREGARIGMLPGYSETDIRNRVQSYLTAGGLGTASPATVQYSNQQVTPGGPFIRVVTVTVEYPSSFTVLSPVAAMVGGGNHGTITLRAASVMRTETVGGS